MGESIAGHRPSPVENKLAVVEIRRPAQDLIIHRHTTRQQLVIEARLTGTQVSIKVTAKDTCKRAREIGDCLTAESGAKEFREKSG